MSLLKPQVNGRKYTPILQKLVSDALCRVECKLVEARTIIEGVKKEKVRWNKKQRWPKGKALEIEIIESEEYNGILFKMVTDTSVNNL